MKKKIFLFLVITVCFSVLFITSVGAFYSASTDDWFIRGDIMTQLGEVPSLGTLRQYSGNGYREIFIYPDDCELHEDKYGCYGFKWSGFSNPNLVGHVDGGSYSLRVSVPWTTFDGRRYLPTDSSYVITYLELYFGLYINYKDPSGNYVPYPLSTPLAQLVDNDGVVSESKSYYPSGSDYGTFRLSISDSYRVSESTQFLNIDISWKGKPSSSREPYLEFSYSRGSSLLKCKPYQDYIAEQNRINQQYLDDLKRRLALEAPEIDSELGPSNLEGLDSFFDFSRESMTFFTTVTAFTLGVCFFGYVLHGKKG